MGKVTYKINTKHALKLEVHHLYAKEDDGSWLYGLLEYSIAPHWFISVADQWNYGNADKIHRTHYYNILGFTYYTQYSNCMLKYVRDDDVSRYFILPESIEYKHSRVAYMNCNIPIEIRYRHPCGFKLDVGVHVGLVAGLSYKYKGPHYNGVDGDYLNYKDLDFYNKQKFSADVYLRMGWKAFGVYYSYQLNKVFETSKGPAMNPMSLGISIALF